MLSACFCHNFDIAAVVRDLDDSSASVAVVYLCLCIMYSESIFLDIN
jgi:hypothetical protein